MGAARLHACTCTASTAEDRQERAHVGTVYRLSWDGATCSEAAEVGHLELLEWELAQDYRWGCDTYVVAVRVGRAVGAANRLFLEPLENEGFNNFRGVIGVWL